MIPTAKFGDRVRVEYTGPMSDGKTKNGLGRRVFEFTVGGDGVLSGINRGVVGMTVGERKQLTLEPQDAYGPVRQNRIKEISRRRLPGNLEPFVGARLAKISTTSGRRRKVRIVEVKAVTVVIDGNHPLAGKVLEIELLLMSMHAPTTDTTTQHRVDGDT